MFARRWSWLSLGLLLGASACKSGGGDPVQELCELALTCSCSVPPFATAEDCVADLDMKTEGYKSMAVSNGLVFDQGCYDRGIAEFNDQVGCAIDFPDASGSCSYCAIVHGDKPVGAACSDLGEFDDCGAGLLCNDGLCSDPCARLAADAACVSNEGGAFKSLGTCADGLYCDFAVTKACTARVAAGGDCFGFDDCQEALACGADNKCGPKPAVGEACVFTCAGDLVCEASICVTLPVEGEACTMNGMCAAELECDDAGNVCVAAEPRLCLILNAD